MWAGLDMRMAASGAQLGGWSPALRATWPQALPALGGAPWARIDFSNGNDFTGAGQGHRLGRQAGPGLQGHATG
jgi:long-chain fatty acid transport protein